MLDPDLEPLPVFLAELLATWEALPENTLREPQGHSRVVGITITRIRVDPDAVDVFRWRRPDEPTHWRYKLPTNESAS